MGAARSGTSLLTSLLGELEGVFAVGEMRLLWKGFDTRLCGCGASVADCPIWNGAFKAAREASGLDDPAEFRTLQATTTRIRHLPKRLSQRPHDVAVKYLRAMESMYVRLSDSSGAGFIVDSSKSPAEAALLASSDRAITSLVHVVRDPRAVVYSWERANRCHPQNKRSTLEATADWIVSNMAAELVMARYPEERRVRVRYEDYVTDPVAALSGLARTLAISAGEMIFLSKGAQSSRSSRHMVGGNALRFDQYAVPLKPDFEWLDQFSSFRSTLVRAATLPLFIRYGYSG